MWGRVVTGVVTAVVMGGLVVAPTHAAGANNINGTVVAPGTMTASIEASLSAVGPVASQRFAGAGRYDTSVAISRTFASGVDVVYVASGEDFPDALAAAPAAAAQGGPLLITPRAGLHPAVATEINRLDPDAIVVVGGELAVSSAVYDHLSTLTGAGGIRRVSGDNRYATARAVIADYWGPESVDRVYIASGRNFPDALSAAAAAGAQGVPVITVDGPQTELDPAVAELIDYLGATKVAVAGGTASVSSEMFTHLQLVDGVTDVQRYAGEDRYGTGIAINRDAFSTSTYVYLASGQNFPDALSGAARAGADQAPLYIVPGTCLPRAVSEDIQTLGATTVRILGGTNAVPLNLRYAQICGEPPVLFVGPPCFGAPAAVWPAECAPVANGGLIPSTANALDDHGALASVPGCHIEDWYDEVWAPCTYGDTGGPRVLVIGDSHARQYLPLVGALADRDNWNVTYATKGHCPWSTVLLDRGNPEAEAACATWLEQARATARSGDFDLIVTSQKRGTNWHSEPGMSSNQTAAVGFAEAWSEALDAGAEILVIEDSPGAVANVQACIQVASNPIAQCSTAVSALGVDPQVDAVASLSDNRVHLVAFTDAYCTAHTCAPIVGHVNIYRNNDHITATWAASLLPVLLDRVGATVPGISPE